MGVLGAAGATSKNIVNMRITLRDIADFFTFNQVLSEFLGDEKVTLTCIGATPNRPGVNVQIDCIAMFDCERSSR